MSVFVKFYNNQEVREKYYISSSSSSYLFPVRTNRNIVYIDNLTKKQNGRLPEKLDAH